ncbi:amidase [Streptosporangium becharense]|uniref:Amidase n=1 Tax=Streptosporangium becharense TaxID=1816182 RepID=A0A7W9IGU5_9ACTN|nr:amidase [Streptosporangium becharense]MBB2912656.1 amidase [Streptosporangium becharense]MBB5820515.1 amidase [Streptosporangium becharense]
MDDLLRLDALGQARAVRKGEVSPRELAEAAIARIEACDGEINAVVHRRFERALAELAEPDGVSPEAPFAGVPTLLKDLGWAMAGEPYRAGSRALDGMFAERDGYAVTKLRRAGFTILGRTNTSEFGTAITTEPVASGPTRNPHDLDFSSGGSSGGSAAAVAAGMVAVATASDGGGSIRIPASMCGLVGLKPSRGRVSSGPSSGEPWAGFSASGLLCRTVRDAAATLDAVAGTMPGDPYGAPAWERPLARQVGADPGRLRIGFLTGHPTGRFPADPDLVAAVTVAATLLEALGHDVEPGGPAALAEDDFARHFGTVVAAHVAADLDEIGRWRGRPVEPEEVEPRNRILATAGRRLDAVGYLASRTWIDGFRRRMAAWWDSHDLLLTPSLGVAPFRLGWLPPDDVSLSRGRTDRAVSFTSPVNATGQPAISLPLHRTAGGMPVGVQLVAAAGREDLLVRVAAQIEAERPFTHPATR